MFKQRYIVSVWLIIISGCVFGILFEGDDCVLNATKETAKCVPLSGCENAKNILTFFKRSPQLCSYKGHMPIVCCADFLKYPKDVAHKADVKGTLQTAFKSSKTGQKALDKCKEYQEGFCKCKIDFWNKWEFICDPVTEAPKVNNNTFKFDKSLFHILAEGGKDAKREQYPHMALLGYGDVQESVEWQCGGSMISYNFVLTAGHCISSTFLGPVKYAALGILKRSDPIKTWQIYTIKTIHKHPGYSPPGKYNDIALLETHKPIVPSMSAIPACLHVGDQVNDTKASATGWGALGNKKQNADTLQDVPLWKVAKENCSAFYKPHRLFMKGYDHSSQMCYGDDGQIRNTCLGDSGGPLQIKNEKNPCMFTILGVTSFGRDCGSIGNPGIYTRVSHYVPWIESIVWT